MGLCRCTLPLFIFFPKFDCRGSYLYLIFKFWLPSVFSPFSCPVDLNLYGTYFLSVCWLPWISTGTRLYWSAVTHDFFSILLSAWTFFYKSMTFHKGFVLSVVDISSNISDKSILKIVVLNRKVTHDLVSAVAIPHLWQQRRLGERHREEGYPSAFPLPPLFYWDGKISLLCGSDSFIVLLLMTLREWRGGDTEASLANAVSKPLVLPSLLPYTAEFSTWTPPSSSLRLRIQALPSRFRLSLFSI